MIEAVNSVLASAPLLRQNAEQQSGAQTSSSSTEAVRETLKAPYVDVVRLDVDYDTAVLELRDSQSGDAIQQIPNEEALIRNKRLAEASERANEVKEVKTASEISETADTGTTEVSSSAPAQVSNPIPSQELAAFSAGQQAASGGSSTTFTTVA